MGNLIDKLKLVKDFKNDLISLQKTKEGCEGFHHHRTKRDFLRSALTFNLYNLRAATINGDLGKEFNNYLNFLLYYLKQAKEERVHQDLYYECDTAIGRAFEEMEKIN